MTRLALVAALFFSIGASPAAAQRYDDAVAVGPSLQLETDDGSTSQHRVGSALLATGLTMNLVGLGAGFVSFIELMNHSGEASCVGSGCGAGANTTGWAALTIGSLAVSGVGLILFFIGLGLDIHAHVLRGNATGLALTPNGLSISF